MALTAPQIEEIEKQAEKTCAMCQEIKTQGGFGPSHAGSKFCMSGSIASGGRVTHCTCDTCF